MILATWTTGKATTPARTGCGDQRHRRFRRAVSQLQRAFGHACGNRLVDRPQVPPGVCSADDGGVASRGSDLAMKCSGKFHGLMQTHTPRALRAQFVGLTRWAGARRWVTMMRSVASLSYLLKASMVVPELGNCSKRQPGRATRHALTNAPILIAGW
jgi:hypothetical protein